MIDAAFYFRETPFHLETGTTITPIAILLDRHQSSLQFSHLSHPLPCPHFGCTRAFPYADAVRVPASC